MIPSGPPAGDFHAVFESELSYVYNSLRRLGAPVEHLEDLAQDVFVTAFRRFDSYDRARPLRPWLFGIAFRVASGHKNRAHVRREVRGDLPDVPSEAAGPEEAALASHARQEVLRALSALDEKHRAIFVLHEIDGLSVPEATEVLDVPLNTAYTRLRKARLRFSEELRRLQGRGAP